MFRRLTHFFLVFCTCAASLGSGAETRVALVSSENSAEAGKVLDAATVLLSTNSTLQLLDRAEVNRILQEQNLPLAGMVSAEQTVKAGQVLPVDLFAVLEGISADSAKPTLAMGLIIFDAKTGVRYADSALLASDTMSVAAMVASTVRTASAKLHRSPGELHTVGLLSVRNVDLPRQFDSLCDSVGLLLERELTASPGIAVLERRRLEQVNNERRLAPDAEGNRLLASLEMLQLDIGRDGDGLRGTLAFAGTDMGQTNKIIASVPTRDTAALARLLADKTERFLNVPLKGITPDRDAEAERFHREYSLLLQHRDYLAAVRSLDAALALAPDRSSWWQEMALLLPNAAIQWIDPGGENWNRPLDHQPTRDDLAHALTLGMRGAELLLAVSEEATGRLNSGNQIPETLNNSNYKPLEMLLEKLSEVGPTDQDLKTEINSLSDLDHRLRMEVIEPLLLKNTKDRIAFTNYTQTIRFWFWPPYHLSPGDAQIVLSHWIDLSHQFNPPDGSGIYRLFDDFLFISRYSGGQLTNFMKNLETDPDLLIQLHARAGLVTLTQHPSGYHTDKTLPAEREFRLYAQNWLAQGNIPKPSPLRNQIWALITEMFMHPLLNHPACAQECLEACRFAISQQDIQPNLFYRSAEVLERKGMLAEELEVVDGALKVIQINPESDPKLNYSYSDRNEVIKDLQQKHDQLRAKLAGDSSKPPGLADIKPAAWSKRTCLIELSDPINGCAWLFKPLAQAGQIFTVALAMQEWGAPEDSLQLIRMAQAGGKPEFLGRAKFAMVFPFAGVDRKYFINLRATRDANVLNSSHDFVRAACLGGGFYAAATGAGIYLFPTNGRPALHLDTGNGLPSDDVHAVAYLEGKFYMGAGDVGNGSARQVGYLASYDPATGKIDILASSRRSEHLSPLDDQRPFFTLALVADTERHRLIMSLTSQAEPIKTNRPAITPAMGIWSYFPATREFKRLTPLLMPTLDPQFWRSSVWSGLADEHTLVVKELFMMALFDLRTDQVVSAYESWEARTNGVMRRWLISTPGVPGNRELADGPFMLRDGWVYSVNPLERMALADGRREPLPPIRDDYPFSPRETFQLTDDRKHILAANQTSLWLLDLNPEMKRNTGRADNLKTASAKP